MEFGNKLYELRKEKGLSQEELANHLEVTRQTVSKWELGDSTPDLDKLVLLAELFEISLDELVLDKVSVTTKLDDLGAKVIDVTDIRYVSYKTMNRITEEEAHKICGQYAPLEDSMPGNLTRFYPE